MQLKRDTDYAIRILFCLKNTISDEGKRPMGMTRAEITTQTKVPRAITARICARLEEKGMIDRYREEQTHEYRFLLTQAQLKRSLLDVVEAVEQTGKIFAVFSKKSPMYGSREEEITQIQNKFEALLASILLEDLIGKRE